MQEGEWPERDGTNVCSELQRTGTVVTVRITRTIIAVTDASMLAECVHVTTNRTSRTILATETFLKPFDPVGVVPHNAGFDERLKDLRCVG